MEVSVNDTVIGHIGGSAGKEVRLKGWVYNFRSSGKIAFLILRDGTGFIQCVLVKGEIGEEYFELAKTLQQEDTIEVAGKVAENPRSPGGYEIAMTSLRIINQFRGEEYPIQKKDHGVDFLLNNRHLWLRSKMQFATLRIRDEIVKAIRDFFYEREFILIDSPIFTPTAPEGTSSLFATDYFGENAFLSQSGQLYQEAGAIAFRKTYCFGPTFRAEKSKTKKHLTEFWMIEPEVAFADLDDMMTLSEDFVCYVVGRVLEKKKEELKILERDTSDLENIKAPFERITYKQAVELVNKGGLPMKFGEDFGADEEDIVSRNFKKPVFIHRFPRSIKPFYMEADPEDGDLVLNMDLIAPAGYGEIIGGSQRMYDLDRLKEEMKKAGLSEKDYHWYVDLRKWGSCPHAGFGLGLERTVAWITGIEHIRTAIPFPRTINRLNP